MAAAAVATSAATSGSLSSSTKAASNVTAASTTTATNATAADETVENVANRKDSSKTSSSLASGEPGQANRDGGLSSEREVKNLHPAQTPAAAAETKKSKEKSAKKLAKKKPPKEQGSKKASRKQQQQENKAPLFDSSNGQQQQQATKPRLLVEELKLFQNNHLLNQQDPIQQLQLQLNGIIGGDDDVSTSNQAHQQNSRSSKSFQQAKPSSVTNGFAANSPLPTSSSEATAVLQQGQQSSTQLSGAAMRNSIIFPFNTEENTFTVKKGVLWQQQIYEKFHKRLFSRWKKRYFILTTDYFVCFKRSSSKVGRSEMGKFLYKTALSDVAKICWSRPTKSDKGAIILHINGQFNLSLWSKDNLDEWMFVINESAERNKIRRSCILQNGANRVANDIKPSFGGCDIYENTALISDSGVIEQEGKQERIGASHRLNLANETTNEHSSNNALAPGEQDNDRSHTITKCSNDKPFEAITKLRSPHRISADEANRKGEPKLSLDIDPPVDHRKESNEVKSSSLSGSSTNSISGSRRADLIEHEHQVEDTDNRKTSTEKTDDVRANRKNRKPAMINQSTAKNNDHAVEVNQANGSGGDVPADYGTKSSNLSVEPTQTTKDLSSEVLKRPAGADDSSSSSKNVGLGNPSDVNDQYNNDDNNNHRLGRDCTSSSPDASLVKKNQSNLVKSGSKRSSRHKLTTKASEESADGETCNSSGSRSRSSKSNDNIRRNESDEAEQFNLVACDKGESSMNDTDLQPKEIANLGEPIENKVATPLQRPTSNLIRRDDSWQSLVSLTRVGKVPPVSVQIAQRSLYAQHILPDTNNGFRDRHQPQHRGGKEEHMINVESTVTPSRSPFLRQQSIQVPNRKLRPMIPLPQQAASFDAVPRSPMLTNQPQRQQQQMQFQQHLQQNTSSYQQRLLQLQLLNSNSNNVDYIRHNGDSSNDYQIYWPESTVYGYSSMRSNLKSAASEFSFIRPSPSTHGQSTLPHQSHLPGRFLDNQGTQQHQQQAIRSSLTFFNKAPNGIQQSDSNNNDIGCLSPLSKQLAQQQQFLVNPMTGERLTNQQALVGAKDLMMVSELTPPMRELPLKPNKKRTLANDASSANGSSLAKSSSLTSSIACFFRRAFSRRSRKKKRRSKLAESCSSSLGAFEDGYSNVPIVPSAFSTGSKSVDGRKNLHNSSGSSGNANLVQSQRMVDMIEAFTNKTLAAAAAAEQANAGSNAGSNAAARFDLISKQQSNQQQQRLQSLNMDLNVTPKVSSQVKNQHQLKSALNQFGSPLHKSNSISATMGLSLADANGRRTYLYDNEIASGGVCGESPMFMRSAKVMSANLTPLMSRREASEMGTAEHKRQQFFVSPRSSKPDQLPRPSSIYGQPSMISSPMITREERNNFGVHRNSLHNQHFRDRNHTQGIEVRRHQMMKVPFLDTTREVAEEISSPTTESKEHDYNHEAYQNQVEQSPYGRYPIAREKFDMISASPSSGRLQQKHPQAIVNPILQSPTMDTIYDNHPMLNGTEMNQSYSLYDNHNHLLMERHRQSPSVQHYMSTEMQPISSMVIANDSPYLSCQINTGRYTPSHQRFSDAERSSAIDMMLINKKPSAIVAPSTPNRNEHLGNDLNSMNSSPIIDRYRNHNQPQSNSQSPMQTRRVVNPQPQYQQSPLVSSQTRVLSKGDRIQATVIGDRGFGSGAGRLAQPVVNIAGAPGINLEPSLAASLLRGTNIDAYESSTFDRLNSSPSQSNSKTFLVSTRLSKSMAYSQSSSNNDNNSTSSSMACNESIVTARSSKDELSSSGSRSMNSSIGQESSSRRRRRANLSTSGNQEEHQDQSSDSDTHRNNKSVNNEEYLHKKSSSSHESSRRKLEESTGEFS